MAPRVHGAERRFFLASPLDAGEERRTGSERADRDRAVVARLQPAEEEHARRVLRLAAGDALIGLDGRGRAWPLVVTAADRKRFEIAICGEPRSEPAPGEPGASLPWIEVASPLPRGARAEDMIDRLVQLGAASFAPLVPARSAPEARAESSSRADRLVKIAAEACKQSGRLWNLHFEPARSCAGWIAARPGARLIFLDPRAGLSIAPWIAAGIGRTERAATQFTREQPLCVVVGPEGGFTPAEEALFAAHGATAVRLGPHVLRIETAAEAALAVVVAAFS